MKRWFASSDSFPLIREKFSRVGGEHLNTEEIDASLAFACKAEFSGRMVVGIFLGRGVGQCFVTF